MVDSINSKDKTSVYDNNIPVLGVKLQRGVALTYIHDFSR